MQKTKIIPKMKSKQLEVAGKEDVFWALYEEN